MTVTVGSPVSGRNVIRQSGGLIPPPGVGLLGLPGPYVYDATSARRVPAVGRAVQLYAGLCKQMPLHAFRGYERLDPPPRILQRPDPTRAGSWFVQVSVEDYLLSGNAIAYVTARGFDGWPLAVTWLPITSVYITVDPKKGETYTYAPMSPSGGMPSASTELNRGDVIHVRRGADRNYPVRGVGIVEEHLPTLDRVAMEEEYERGALSDSGVPSVAVISPSANLTQDTADQAKADWVTKFSGPVREPVILPNGTIVQPLAWSPSDAQLVEARRMSLLDVANMFNLDGYWLGAPVAGMTYRTAGPQYQQILRTSLEPLLADFEDVWSNAWLPRGTEVRFERSQLLREDLATSMTAATTGYGAGIMTLPESRVMVGLPPENEGAIGVGAGTTPAGPTPAEPTDPNEPDESEGETGGDAP
jgi:HK97 family phage portal protein